MKRFSVKDVFSIQGHATSLGVKPPPFPPSERTAPVISKLLKADFELAAIVSLDPLCASMKGENPYYGNVENPVYFDLPCLGSSCGSAASIITGNLSFSLGTDSGGSIRAPAASVDLWSFKGTSDFLPREGVYLFHPKLDSIGVIAKRLETLLEVAELFGKAEPDDDKIESIVIPHKTVLDRCSKKIRAAFLSQVAALSKHYTIQEILSHDFFEEAVTIRKPLLAWEMRDILKTVPLETPELKALALFAQSLTPDQIKNAERSHADYCEKWLRILPRNSVLFTPTLPNETLDDTGTISLNYFLVCANILDLPAVSLPGGGSAYPCSMQVLATNRRNFSVLGAAKEIGTKNVTI